MVRLIILALPELPHALHNAIRVLDLVQWVVVRILIPIAVRLVLTPRGGAPVRRGLLALRIDVETGECWRRESQAGRHRQKKKTKN